MKFCEQQFIVIQNRLSEARVSGDCVAERGDKNPTGLLFVCNSTAVQRTFISITSPCLPSQLSQNNVSLSDRRLLTSSNSVTPLRGRGRELR